MDLVARVLEREPAEIRAKNMIRADEMPYRVGMPYRDGEPIVYDSGDYQKALRSALDAIGGVAGFRQQQENRARRRPSSRARHRLLRRGTGGRPVRKRDGAYRSFGEGLRLLRRMPAGAGDGDHLRAGRGGYLVGRSRRRRHHLCRYVRRSRWASGRSQAAPRSRCRRPIHAASERLREKVFRDRRQPARMRRKRPRAAQTRGGHRRCAWD